jgi:hypothetical protein
MILWKQMTGNASGSNTLHTTQIAASHLNRVPILSKIPFFHPSSHPSRKAADQDSGRYGSVLSVCSSGMQTGFWWSRGSCPGG